MFRLLSRPKCRPIAARRRPRARLSGPERLETRDCPAAPVLSMTAHAAAGGMLQIAGRVTDDNPTATVVHLTGSVKGDATPDANGYYNVTLSPSDGGAVVAQAVDAQGQTSNQVSDGNFTDDNAPPAIYFEYAQRYGHSVYLQGYVLDDRDVSS